MIFYGALEKCPACGDILVAFCLTLLWSPLFLRFLLKHDIHIKPKSYKLELLGELVV